MTVAPGLLRAGLALVAIALAGACAFGLWHVIGGGLIGGNPRAAAFGIALATVSGAGALAAVWLARRHSARA
jgi:hypothetical protein